MKIIKKVIEKKMDLKEAIFLILKYHPKSSIHLDGEIENLDFRQVSVYDSYRKRFNEMIHNIQLAYEDKVEELKLEEIFKYLDKGDTIENYFIDNDVKILKDLMEFEFQKKKFEPFIKNVKLSDLIPKEVFEIIFSYLGKDEMKLFSLNISKSDFNWISSNKYLINQNFEIFQRNFFQNQLLIESSYFLKHQNFNYIQDFYQMKLNILEIQFLFLIIFI